MSKESYARGFCKAAADAGVDPKVLFKFAQEFKTNGWAPPSVASLGTSVAPLYGYDDDPQPGEERRKGNFLYERTMPISSGDGVLAAKEYLDNDGFGGRNIGFSALKYRSDSDPRYAAWLNSHAKAINQLVSAIKGAVPDKRISPQDIEKDFNAIKPGLAESIAKAYHDSMAKSTGAVSRVSAPAKK
jgi:hypothetical protein